MATTVKTSKGNETVSQTVARAKAMLGSAYNPNTKTPSASRVKEISEQSFIEPEVKKAYDKSVSAMALANTETPTLPTPTVAQTPGLNLAVTNASLGQTDANGMYQIPEMTVSETAGAGEKAAVDSVNALGQQIQGYLGLNKPEEGASEKALAKAREQAGVQAAQQEFNRYQNQINAITSQRDAQILSLEGQGRGQTQGFIGGEQARISREAAIMALPVQAQLAAAQGNLEQAKELMGQLYQAKSADIQADMTYRTNLVNSLISFASNSQQTVLQAKLADNAQASQIAQQNLAYQHQLGLQALEYGQNNLVTGIANIDPKSPTFEQDIAKYTSKLRKPVAAASSPWKLQDVNGVSSWVNSETQEIKPVGGVDGSNLKPVKDLEIRDLNDTWTAKNSIVSIIDDMTNSIETEGTKIFWGTEAGKRGANKTNLLLAMKNLEKTGALDKGTIDVLADLIPENEFWATENAQIASLNQLKETIVDKTDEFVGSYRGTTAEIDPRTKRIYGTVDISTLPQEDIIGVYDLFGVSNSTSSGTFNADEWLR